MVVPTTFGFDEQTAQTNVFQHRLNAQSAAVQQAALHEFNDYVELLRAHDITVLTFEDLGDIPKPNAVFPNNWISTWPDGTVYLYPMATESRRVERSQTAIDLLKERYAIEDVVDLSAREQDGAILESTGVMVFDHESKTAYACISPRCDRDLFIAHSRQLGYTPVAFHATDHKGTPIYHTNVMLGIQARTAVICSESIANDTERRNVLQVLADSGHEIIDINFAQMEHFCGNVLSVQNRHGESFVILSQSAYDAFSEAQRNTLAKSGTLLPVNIPTIETVGGGSARCMLAEIFLPVREPAVVPAK